MKTYWDYTEKERAEMTREAVESLLKFELMKEGVVDSGRPELLPVEETKLESATFYEVMFEGKYNHDESSMFLFSDQEDARAFIALNPFKITSEYDLPTDAKFAKRVSGGCVKEVQYPYESEVREQVESLKASQEAKAENERRMKVYNANQARIHEVVQPVWDDFAEQRGKQGRLKRIVDTYDQYVTDCEGDKVIAARFLAKAFDENDINAAFDWFGREPVVMEAVETVEA